MELTTLQLELTGARDDVTREVRHFGSDIEVVTRDRFGVIRPIESAECDERGRIVINLGSGGS
jgi:hypothetical protein